MNSVLRRHAGRLNQPHRTGCLLTPSSPKIQGFGKVFYRWLIPTS